jgi:hypothetical protein
MSTRHLLKYARGRRRRDLDSPYPCHRFPIMQMAGITIAIPVGVVTLSPEIAEGQIDARAANAPLKFASAPR